MDDLSLLDDLDRRLDPLVSDVPLPADLVSRGRAVRRRRSRTVGAAVAAAVVLVAGIGFVVAQRPAGTPTDVAGDPAPTTTPTAAPVLDVPAGSRLVGYGGVAVAVPTGWIPGQNPCLIESARDPDVLSLRAPQEADDCFATPTVSVQRSTVPPRDDCRPTMACPNPEVREETINGLDVVLSDRCPQNALCVSAFVSVHVPSLGVTVTATGGTKDLRTTIIASIRPMPAGMTAVPPVDLPTDFDTVCRALVAAELLPPSESITCDDDVFADVAALRPAAGSVVPAWSVVEPVVRY